MHDMCLVSGIQDFINQGLQNLSKFESLVKQILNNEKEIESKLQLIMMSNMLKFPAPDTSSDVPGRRILFICCTNKAF